MLRHPAFGLLAALLLASCAGATVPNANLRVIHASANTPNVDVYVGGTAAANRVLSNVAFKEVTRYQSLTPGAADVRVCEAGKDATVTANCPIVVPGLNLESGKSYTVLAAGRLGLSPALEALVATDSNAPSATPSNFKLRVIHAAATAPGSNGAVDVYVTAAGASIASIQPNLTGFVYKQASAYLEFPGGDYQVRVTLPGQKTAVIDSGTLAMQAGKVYTVVALDPGLGGSSLQAIRSTDN